MSTTCDRPSANTAPGSLSRQQINSKKLFTKTKGSQMTEETTRDKIEAAAAFVLCIVMIVAIGGVL